MATTMVEIVHPESDGTGRCPEAALAHQRKLGWVTKAEHEAAEAAKAAKPKPAPPTPTPQNTPTT